MMVKLEFAVGNVYDPQAGIHGGAVSPWFELATDAYAWCADNETFLDGMFGDPEPVRQAKCYLCKKMQPAVDGLAYSGKRGEGEYDIIDCGCRGWD